MRRTAPLLASQTPLGPCNSLTGTALGAGAAAGSVGETFTLTNTGSASCLLSGARAKERGAAARRISAAGIHLIGILIRASGSGGCNVSA